MGTIHEATNVNTGGKVAVKILHSHLSSDEGICSRFDREARASSRLSHPNCIQIDSHGILEDGRRFIAMEFIDGKNLEEVLLEHRQLTPDAVIAIGLQVAEALRAAHEEEVIHRDLKPANILLEKGRVDGPTVRVCDFGIAKILNSSKNSYQTLAGVVCGTPDYISPEQARGLPLDGRADLYSLGIVLFELLVGRPPFEGKNALELMNKHIRSPLPDLRNLRGDIPENLVVLIEKMLSKKADQRPANANEVISQLEAIRTGTPLRSLRETRQNLEADFALDDTIEQARLSETLITRMQKGPDNVSVSEEGMKPPTPGETPLSVMMVGVIVLTCIVYAVFAIFFAP